MARKDFPKAIAPRSNQLGLQLLDHILSLACRKLQNSYKNGAVFVENIVNIPANTKSYFTVYFRKKGQRILLLHSQINKHLPTSTIMYESV